MNITAQFLWPSLSSQSFIAPLLEALAERPWEALDILESYILSLGEHLAPSDYRQLAPDVWVAHSAKIAPSAHIGGPCIIGAESEVRHCAYIRGSVLVGAGVVVGNSTELKNCILFDRVQVPHFNYVGDSILGYRAHLGAGAVTANVRLDRQNVFLRGADGTRVESGRRKLGALIGDGAEIGCHAVLCPGAVVSALGRVLPGEVLRGERSGNTSI